MLHKVADVQIFFKTPKANSKVLPLALYFSKRLSAYYFKSSLPASTGSCGENTVTVLQLPELSTSAKPVKRAFLNTL
jgi:hypothetical protein